MSTMVEEASQVLANADLLYSDQQVQEALDRMGEAIHRQLAGSNPVVLAVMTGGLVTAGQLLPRMRCPLVLDYVHATRYRDGVSGGEIEWISKPRIPLQDRTVLVIDDILDEGLTLKAILDYCKEQGARDVFSAVLVDKFLDREKALPAASFTGLSVGDRYVFGAGMDYKGYLRNVPAIYALRSE
jgi:hypoxanthine phosphoribosyltransferase